MLRPTGLRSVLCGAIAALALGGAVAAAQAPPRVAATYPLGMLLPDSEFLYGPTVYGWDIAATITTQRGYLAVFSEVVDGEVLTGAEVISGVAREYSVGPRMLLTLVEMNSGWVRNPEPTERTFAVGEPVPGLRAGLARAAASLNQLYYAHRYDGLRTITLAGGETVELPDANAATFALLAYLARETTIEAWPGLEASSQFYMAWTALFSDPYLYHSSVVLPDPLPPVELLLPFPPGEVWYYVAGPHSAAGPGTPLSAIDFAPPPEVATGCHLSLAAVTAVAPGVVARSRGAEVVVDLDGDGFEGSGWTHHYRHLAAFDRVAEGTWVKAGDLIGHPSCEGGEPTLTRVSFARRYNGEWIPVDYPGSPLVLGGWVVGPGREPGAGTLARPGYTPREASLTKIGAVNGVAALPGAP